MNSYSEVVYKNETYWDLNDEKDILMHKIHAYPAKFPGFLVRKAYQYAIENGTKVNQMGDIFCGCGTTALESARLNIDFWGCDINPIATMIAKVKSRKYSSKKLGEYFELIKNNYEKITIGINEIKQANSRISYWFDDDHIANLLRLKKSIDYSVPHNSYYYSFFQCAFSNILKPTSRWLSKSIKPQIDPQKKPLDVFFLFDRQYKFMLKANEQNDLKNKSNIKIKQMNSLNLKIEESFIDLLVTSPPYVTSYEYADLHQLSTLWLDYTDDYKKLRNGSIGSVYQITEEIKRNNIYYPGNEIVKDLQVVDRSKAKAVAKYYIDMQNIVEKCFSILNPGGMAIIIIGNTSYKNILINNSDHIITTMTKAGFLNIKKMRRKISGKNLTPYRDKIGRFTKNKLTSRKIYHEEFIVVGRKASD